MYYRQVIDFNPALDEIALLPVKSHLFIETSICELADSVRQAWIDHAAFAFALLVDASIHMLLYLL